MINPLDLLRQKRIDNKQKLAEYRKKYWSGQLTNGEIPMGSGQLNRDGNPKLPPGQHETRKWPVLDLGIHPEISKETWRLEIRGLVERPMVLSWEDFMGLPQTEDVSDFHCVTAWSRFDVPWVGVRFAELAQHVGIKPEATHVLVHGYDGYTTNLSLEQALKYDVLIVHSADGQPLSIEHGGPARMITPQLYAWKGAKWIKAIDFMDHDERGFWENRGYSNTAEPWLNDRYSRD
jgi:DMSO/TMAO reductase YedYZ molybdopterin-dependent catalytic subunit